MHKNKKEKLINTRAQIEHLIIENKDDEFMDSVDRTLTKAIVQKKKQPGQLRTKEEKKLMNLNPLHVRTSELTKA